MTDAEQLAAQAGFRCQGYWLLSRLFLEPPGAAFLGEVQGALAAAEGDSPELRADIGFLRDSIGDALQDPEAAAVAFTRHLVAISKGGGEALPIESQFVRGRSRDPINENLLQKIGNWGYGAALVPSTPPDHLGAELRLMAWLCNDERGAWERGDADAAIDSLNRQTELLNDHLVQWIPDYCRSLAERAENPYVKAIARIAATTLEAETGYLNELCAQMDIPSLR